MSKRRLIPTKHYSKEQIKCLLDHTSPHERVAFALAIHAGLSPEELVQLAHTSFDLQNNLIFVPAIESQYRRYIRIAPAMCEFITPFLGHQKGTAYAFCQCTGIPLSRLWLARSLERALHEANFEICALDDLRWSGAGWLLEAGVPYAVVAARFAVTRETLYRRFPRTSPRKRSHPLPLEEVLPSIAVY